VNQVYSLTDENFKYPFCITTKIVIHKDALLKNTFKIDAEKKYLILQAEIYLI